MILARSTGSLAAVCFFALSCSGGSGTTNPAGGGSGGTGAGGSGASGGAGGTAIYGPTCAQVEQLSCWSGDCETYAQGTLDQAAKKGCTAQAVAAFECFQDHPPICDPKVTGLTPDPACVSAVNAYLDCIGGGSSCTRSGFLGQCSLVCSSTFWAVQCQVGQGNSYWDCLCRDGPHAGTTFTLPPADKCDETLSAAKCAN